MMFSGYPQRKTIAYVISLSLLLLLASTGGCTTMRSGAHQADDADLRNYRYFTWIAPDPWIVSAEYTTTVSPLTRRKISKALRAAFEDAGYVFVTNKSEADFVVAYTIGTREKIDVAAYPVIYRRDWDWYPYSRDYPHTGHTTHSYTEGTLGVDIFDARTRQPVWHGWATKRVAVSDLDDPSDSIRKAAEAIASHLPLGSQ
ncbi:MAG: DUF4136 domain-containing protein [Pseudomonadota bacterium]